MIRLYAHLQGSFRTVSLGLQRAFQELGVLDGYYVGEDAQDFDAPPVGGAISPIAVVVGDPLRCLMAHTQGDHKEIWLMLAPNSEGVPPRLVQELSAVRGGRRPVDGLLAPSTWSKRVLEKVFPNIPVELCVHGVLSEFRMDRELREMAQQRQEMVALHLTSTNMDRKGTRELVRAWVASRLGRKNPPAKLIIGVNPKYTSELSQFVQETGPGDNIALVNGQNLEFTALSESMQRVNFVVQPSRAEGFGLVPLEARACGVPVVMTDCTGHGEHAGKDRPGTIIIPSGRLSGSDDYWGAQAPGVAVEDIKMALLSANLEREQHERAAISGAEKVSTHWTWERGVGDVVNKWKRKYR